MTKTQRHVLTTACLAHGLIHVYELSVPALLIAIQAEFGVGDLRLGEIVNVYAMLFGAGSLPAGWLSDRIGANRLLTLCLWSSAVAILGMALSPTLPMFAFTAACMGLGLSIYHPAGTALISYAVAPTGRVFALHGMAGNTGVALAAVVAGSLGALFGWRWALGLLAIPGVVLGFLALRLPTPSLQEIRAASGRGRWPLFAILLIAAAMMGMVYRGMTTFLPKLFAVRFESGTALAGLMTTLTLIVGLAGMWASGWAADRGARPAYVFLIGALGQVPFLVALAFAPNPLLLPLAMGVAFFHFTTQPVGNKMVSEFTPPRLRGLGYGIYFFMTFGAGSLGATASGWVSERFELAWAIPALAILLIPTAVAMLILGHYERRADTVRR
jgi:MFS family permease